MKNEEIITAAHPQTFLTPERYLWFSLEQRSKDSYDHVKYPEISGMGESLWIRYIRGSKNAYKRLDILPGYTMKYGHTENIPVVAFQSHGSTHAIRPSIEREIRKLAKDEGFKLPKFVPYVTVGSYTMRDLPFLAQINGWMIVRKASKFVGKRGATAEYNFLGPFCTQDEAREFAENGNNATMFFEVETIFIADCKEILKTIVQ
jgi:hypothetical protein